MITDQRQQARSAYQDTERELARTTADWEAARQNEVDKRMIMNAAAAAHEKARADLLALALQPDPEPEPVPTTNPGATPTTEPTP